jgi:hypothetical protein
MQNRGNDRITLDDNALTACMKLGEGNPGALEVCAQLYKQGIAVDPDALGGFPGAGIAQLMALDSDRIYGPRIWMLYKDVCGMSYVKTIGLLRAVQLGFISSEKLAHAIDNRGAGINLDDLMAKVRERLPRFAKDEVPCQA